MKEFGSDDIEDYYRTTKDSHLLVSTLIAIVTFAIANICKLFEQVVGDEIDDNGAIVSLIYKEWHHLKAKTKMLVGVSMSQVRLSFFNPTQSCM